jgi:hypothetical protein
LNNDVPGFVELKNFKLPLYEQPQEFFTPDGIAFHANMPSTFIHYCFGNPMICCEIVRLPILPKKYITEIYHARRWHLDYQCPMVLSDEFGHIFKKDFVTFLHQLYGSTLGQVLKFYQNEDENVTSVTVKLLLTFNQLWKFFPDVSVSYPPNHETLIICNEIDIKLSDVTSVAPPPSYQSLLILQDNMALHSLGYQDYQRFISQHALKAAGIPVVIAPLLLYSDDTSGNRSKKWNKFDVWCCALASIPKDKAHNLTNIFFISCSNRTSAVPMSGPIVDNLKLLEGGIRVFDSVLMSEVLVIAPVICLLCDNARSSELLNHLGSKAVKLCRICNTSDATVVGDLRSKQQTLEYISKIALEPTKKQKKELRTKYGLHEKDNPLFKLSLDLYKSSPVEVLHTILLGCCKYMLRQFMNDRSANQKKQIMARIKSFPHSGMNCMVSSNISYFKSFVGRDFKSLMQMALFVFEPYFNIPEKKCWLLLSKVDCNNINTYYNCRYFVLSIVYLSLLLMKITGEVCVTISY